MKYNVLLRPEAEADLIRAFQWYEDQRRGIGSTFLLHVDASISSIKRNPEQYPLVFKNVRRVLVRRFPFGIFYVLHENKISVLAVFHAKRNPNDLKNLK